ncbi:MAG: site-specific integrase, partial [Alistipes sp.]|nr:site-specific integrase [Alistipes sp.]
MKISDVTLRTRPTKDGRLALYLHFSPAIRHPETMKLIHTEQLGIYIWEHPANVAQQQHNEDILIKAEVIRSLRVQSLINEEYGFLDHHKRNADFLE